LRGCPQTKEDWDLAGKPKQREKLRFGDTRQEAQNDWQMRMKIEGSLPLLVKTNGWKTKITTRKSRELLTGGMAVKRKNTKLLAGPGWSHETKWWPKHTTRKSKELLIGNVAMKRKNTKLLAGPGRSHKTKWRPKHTSENRLGKPNPAMKKSQSSNRETSKQGQNQHWIRSEHE
jgi:hypothetical protein